VLNNTVLQILEILWKNILRSQRYGANRNDTMRFIISIWKPGIELTDNSKKPRHHNYHINEESGAGTEEH
jgi:hypothetical protein